MLELKLGRLLDAHQLLVLERGHFEQAAEGLRRNPNKTQWVMGRSDFMRLRAAIADVESISKEAGLTSTYAAAQRTNACLEKLGRPEEGQDVFFPEEGCKRFFHHLMDITSRLRDDADSRLYYQIAPANETHLEPNSDHFGKDAARAFGNAVEDIAEAAACLALERPTACVFHLMRALEVAVAVVAVKLNASIVDQHGRGLAWGIIAKNMKDKIDKMTKGSDEQAKWYAVQNLLEGVNRAWRVPTAHPKKTYTLDEARRVFDATRGFMQELATIA